MKLRFPWAAWVLILALAGCTPAAGPFPGAATTPPQTAPLVQIMTGGPGATPAPPGGGSPTAWITPKMTATPLNFNLEEVDAVRTLIHQFHPGICSGLNLARLTPPPEDWMLPARLTFTEVAAAPDPQAWIIIEIADNLDGSRQALIACRPDHCVDVIYVRDNTTGEIQMVDFEAMSWRPIQWLIWLNPDTFLVAQSANPHQGLFVAINVRTQSYEYYGPASDCPPSAPTLLPILSTPLTPTP